MRLCAHCAPTLAGSLLQGVGEGGGGGRGDEHKEEAKLRGHVNYEILLPRLLGECLLLVSPLPASPSPFPVTSETCSATRALLETGAWRLEAGGWRRRWQQMRDTYG